MQKIIFFDIDGTLSDAAHGIPSSAIEAINTLKQNNHIVCICTGRTRDTIQEDILKMDFDGIIAGGGCHIEFKGEILLETYIPKEVLGEVIELLNQYELSYSLEARNQVYMTKKMSEYLAENVKRLRGTQNSELEKMMNEREKIKYEDTMSDFNLETDNISKICFLTTHQEQVDQVCKSVKNHLQVISHYSKTQDIINAEIVRKGFNKGTAVKYLCEYLDVKLMQTIAFGDSMNDLDLFDAVAYSVAMEDAIDELKQRASICCESVVNDGIYKQLKRMSLI